MGAESVRVCCWPRPPWRLGRKGLSLSLQLGSSVDEREWISAQRPVPRAFLKDSLLPLAAGRPLGALSPGPAPHGVPGPSTLPHHRALCSPFPIGGRVDELSLLASGDELQQTPLRLQLLALKKKPSFKV